MGQIKRAWWSVRHQKKRTGILFLLITVVVTMLLTGLGIRQAVDQTNQQARESIKPEMVISYDHEKIFNNQGSDVPEIDSDIKEKAAKLDHVTGVETETKTYVNSKYQLSLTKDQETIFGNDSGQMMSVGGNKDAKPPTQYLYGMDSAKVIPAFAKGESFLTEGEYPFDSKLADPLMVSTEFAKKNNLKLGDKVQANGGIDCDRPIEYTICGLFQAAEVKKSQMGGMTIPDFPMDSSANVWYSNMATTEKTSLLNDPKGKMTYESIKLKLSDPQYLEQVKKQAQALFGKKADFISFSSGSDNYQEMTAAINNVAKIANILILLAVIAGIAILSLVLILSFKDRRYEIGVLLAMGEGRRKLTLQILTEVLLVMVCAFGLAVGISQVTSNQISAELVAGQVAAMTETAQQTGGGDQIIFADSLPDETSKSEPIDKIQVNILNRQTLGMAAVFSLLIAILSTLLPMLGLFRQDPKTILVAAA